VQLLQGHEKGDGNSQGWKHWNSMDNNRQAPPMQVYWVLFETESSPPLIGYTLLLQVPAHAMVGVGNLGYMGHGSIRDTTLSMGMGCFSTSEIWALTYSAPGAHPVHGYGVFSIFEDFSTHILCTKYTTASMGMGCFSTSEI
jgi:hypothetical protein